MTLGLAAGEDKGYQPCHESWDQSQCQPRINKPWFINWGETPQIVISSDTWIVSPQLNNRKRGLLIQAWHWWFFGGIRAPQFHRFSWWNCNPEFCWFRFVWKWYKKRDPISKTILCKYHLTSLENPWIYNPSVSLEDPNGIVVVKSQSTLVSPKIFFRGSHRQRFQGSQSQRVNWGDPASTFLKSQKNGGLLR